MVYTANHVNNFDFLRLIFALAVLVTHSYALIGVAENDVLFQFSHGQASFSHTAVQGFLVISGYLITKSLLRSRSLGDYFFKRSLRVFPGLWVTVAITVIVCFFFSGKSITQYLTHYSTRDYVFFNSLLKIQYNINGVFTQNPYPNAVNGSLWTIPYEFFFYIVLSACYFIRQRVELLRWVFGAAFLILAGLFLAAEPVLHYVRVPFWSLEGQHLAELGAFFLSGSVWAMLPLPSVRLRRLLAAGSFLLWLASLLTGGYAQLQFVTLPVLVISFGSLNTPWLSWIRKYGDFSYGIYLWGFVVQQTLMHLFHLGLVQLMVSSIVATYLCGALSWHLIEKQALRLKLRAKP